MANNIFVLANSPGELSGWVKPVLLALAAKELDVDVTFVALPCPYASGRESACAKELPLVRRTSTVSEVLHGHLFSKSDSSLILQFGGDPFYGFILSRRLNATWFMYGTRPRFSKFVDFYFVPDKAFVKFFKKKGVSSSKYSVVGNLMVDSVESLVSQSDVKRVLGVSESRRLVSVLLGSRPFEYEFSAAFFVTMAIDVLKRFDDCDVVMPIAPTVDNDILCSALSRAGFSCERGFPKEIRWGGRGRILLVRENTFDVIKSSVLAVALPGTNNLQIASLGVPLVMFAPLNEAEKIPLDGLPGLIPTSSGLLRAVKRRLVFWFNARERFVSLPNRLSGVEIVPEHRYVMTPYMASDVVCGLLSDDEKLARIRDGYGLLDLSRGAASKIADFVVGFFRKS